MIELSRTMLPGGLGVLVIDTYPTGDFWLPEDGLTEPEFEDRTIYADTSAHVPGGVVTQSVTGLGTLAFTAYTRAATSDELKSNKRMLEATVRQFRFTTTLTVVGAPDVYASLPGKVSWGEVDSGMVRALIAKAVVTIPVQPLGA